MTDGTDPHDRRGGARIEHELDVVLHLRDQNVPLRATNVSRHGMFLSSKLIFPPHRAVFLTVKLKSGPFETMASIVRRVEDGGRGQPLGIGLKLFCLGAEPRERWDRFVAGLEHKPLDLKAELSTRTARAAASFLVQPDDPAGLLEFFTQNILTSRTLHVSPAVRKVGAEIEFVLVHPVTHEESVHRGRVVDWNPDHPQRMGVQILPPDAEAKRAFREFARGASTSDNTEEILLLQDVVPPSLPPQPPEDLDVVEGVLLQPDFELVDPRVLFDFNWNAEEK